MTFISSSNMSLVIGGYVGSLTRSFVKRYKKISRIPFSFFHVDIVKLRYLIPVILCKAILIALMNLLAYFVTFKRELLGNFARLNTSWNQINVLKNASRTWYIKTHAKKAQCGIKRNLSSQGMMADKNLQSECTGSTTSQHHFISKG